MIAVFEHWLLLCISSSASHFNSQSRSHADEQTSARHLVSLRALARALSDNADPLSSFARSLLSHLEPAAATLSPVFNQLYLHSYASELDCCVFSHLLQPFDILKVCAVAFHLQLDTRAFLFAEGGSCPVVPVASGGRAAASVAGAAANVLPHSAPHERRTGALAGAAHQLVE